ncbi:MAG TPA: class I adenylate-forming enzyme family protein [Terracidiphilus sp.]|nr:class I adenylate-forming enzyme family protein [Terracidiphilus sp.]
MRVPQFTLDDYERVFADRHLLHGVVAKWAKERPDAPAILSAEGDRAVSWSDFDRITTALARELLRLGFAKGDFLVTLLPLSVDHVLLEYSCFKIGVIVAPLDLRLSPAEVIRALEILRPRRFAGLGVKAPFDFRPLWRTVQADCKWIRHFITVDSDEVIPGTQSFASIAEPAWRAVTDRNPETAADSTTLAGIAVAEDDGALVIFTTGSTGSPKPALLSHRNITVQNMCICGAFFGGDRGSRTLVNLPASHVGGQTEELMSTFFGGGTAVLLEVFDAGRSLRAVTRHGVEVLGQIPAMFNLEWMLKDYDGHDLSSLRIAVWGGHAVSRPFVDRLAAMAPVIGTGLGLTEAAGFCTYIQSSADDKETVLAGLGVDMPIYPCTIRQAMRADGNAGDELPPGEIGCVCFCGPQTFLGYVNDPAATAHAISRDGFLYTGDLGFKDAAGLHLTGREKWVIKSFGYQIFPGDVEAHICALASKVANCVVVGVAHEVASEAVVAVVEKKPGVELSRRELDRHARSLPSYMRPRHWIILSPGQMPLNRVVKPDYGRAQEMARQEIAELRARGEWDRSYT